MGVAGKLIDAAASLLLGARCPGCRTPCARLCAVCAKRLAALEPGPVQVAGAPPVAAAGPYAGVLPALLVAHKERHATWLATPLGGLLAQAVALALLGDARPGAVTLVPMPSHAGAVRERGVDTTALLARCAARALSRAGLPCRVSSELRHVRRVADQSGLDAAGRRANLAGALAARGGAPGVRVVVDDLTTTGASLAEACRALARAGTPASACAVVAAAERRDGRARGSPRSPRPVR